MRGILSILFGLGCGVGWNTQAQLRIPDADTLANVSRVSAPTLPTAQQGLPPPPAAFAASSSGSNNNQQNAALMQMLKALGSPASRPLDSNPRTNFGDDLPAGTSEYPNNFRFYYGGQGAGNIGNGLCTEKNKDRSQVKNGHCAILAKVLEQDGSCANNAVRAIISEAQSGQLKQMNDYCPRFNQFSGTQKTMVLEQLLAGLITKESGWNPHATEPSWSKNGQPMGGKGLFQIGVNDRGQNADCAGLNGSSIYDPEINLKCGACIALKNIAKDSTIGYGHNDNGSYGLARYFGPFRDGQARKREDIRVAVSQYCSANASGSSGDAPVGSSSGSVQ